MILGPVYDRTPTETPLGTVAPIAGPELVKTFDLTQI